MRRLILAAALVVALQPPAFARTAMETNQLVDDNGAPIGVAPNPLVVSFAGGGGAITVNQGAPAADTPQTRWPTIAYQGGAWSVGVNNFPATWATTSAQLPAALGPNTAANSLTVTLATDGIFRNTVGLSNDAAWDGSAASASQTAILKALTTKFLSGTIKTDGSGVTQPVSGTVTLGPGSNVIGSVTQSGGPWSVSGTVAATQSGTWSVGLASGVSVLADLRVGGAANASGNPIFAQVTNLPATQAVSGTVTANLGTLNGAALDASVQAVKTALGSPFQAGGSIGNTAFGVSGTLPAFAATPTFNIGTTNGLALDATLTARLGTLGQKASAASAPVVLASDQSAIPISGTVTANLGTLNGASTAANQQSEITQLTTTNQRSTYFAEPALTATLANGSTTGGGTRSAGASPSPFVSFRTQARADQAVILVIQASDDGFATYIEVGRQTLAANVTTQLTVPVMSLAYRAVISNTSGSASAVSAKTAFTTN